MDYVRLGRSGLKVSRVCLGTMSFGDPKRRSWFLTAEQADPIVRRAVEAGVNFFDTADMYSVGRTEEIVGDLLGGMFPNRDDYVLATKVYYPVGSGPNDRGLSRKHIMAAIDASLRRLNTDHVDVGPDYSDVQLAETFLHHRVLIVPVVDQGRVVGVITRADLARAGVLV